MATNLNNTHINSFTKGMNTDTSLDMIGNELYVFGQNIRITGNALLGALIDSNNKEGVITPVPAGVTTETTTSFTKILATASIENIGAVIVTDSSQWYVYRVDCNDNKLEFTKIFESKTQAEKDRFSVVINKELNDAVKLYIADGKNEIMMINLSLGYDYYKNRTIDQLTSNKIYPDTQLTIAKLISGKLKTQQLQYTYRFYKKYGVCSRPAPLTNKIQVIDGNRSRENGNAADTETTVGFSLNIPYDYEDLFDHVLLYRISYLKPNVDAEINLIYDAKIPPSTKTITINDTGLDSLLTLSPEEFASLTDLNIVPQCVELNLNYLFAANTKDETVLRLTDSGITHDWLNENIKTTLVSTHIPLHKNYKFSDPDYQDIPNLNGNDIYDKSTIYTVVKNSENDNNLSTDLTGEDYLELHKVCKLTDYTYNDLIISSMFRSLRRDETYRYGIIFYDKYGKRTNVNWLNDIQTPTEQEYSSIITVNNVDDSIDMLYARPIGIMFNITQMPDGYESYQIVRCAKTPEYTKNLLQCVLSRPVRQPLANTYVTTTTTESESGSEITTSTCLYSPYYPMLFLSTNYYEYDSGFDDDYYLGNANNFDNDCLFLIFNPQINILRNDLLLTLSNKNMKIHPIAFRYGSNSLFDDLKVIYRDIINNDNILDNDLSKENPLINSNDSAVEYIKYKYKYNLVTHNNTEEDRSLYKKYKLSSTNIFYYYNQSVDGLSNLDIYRDIKNISDVLNPTWEQGWSNITPVSNEDTTVSTGTKQYKGFTSNIGNYSYVNWVCNNLYDLQVGTTSDHKDGSSKLNVYDNVTPLMWFGKETDNPGLYGLSCQGPGPVCYLIELSNTNDVSDKYPFNNNGNAYNNTILCNITHDYTNFAGDSDEEKQYDIYYGFGNTTKDKKYIVFDGDVYITPCEIVTMFKTYDFLSKYTLMSNLFIYYVPMETVINTYFDYGMNYMNTQNKNLLLEPGDITGVSVQDRPLNQYNLIYSDNNISNDVYNTESLEETENTYTQRIHYSELKTNGESIDNWMDFKSLNYIDADTRYGQITNLLTNKSTLYFWLTLAFGKLSVNERSLVTDNNNNTIQLGQGGVLQRTDYIDTKHGMRENDFSAINAENAIFWIDMMNKAVVQSNGEQVINYSEQTNVLNIVNRAIDYTNLPNIDYDIQNNELLCLFLKDGQQLVFNIKLQCCTGIYNRKYTDTIIFNNTIYGLYNLSYTQYNYLYLENGYLKPTELSFCVNPNSSTTKVFDNQEIVTLYRGDFESDNSYMEDKIFTFNTNLYKDIKIQPDGSTDREGNIRYCIPRTENQDYGNRMRGKWLQVDIVDNSPEYKESISHVITTFRQSFS